jgi:hypothetical protein
MNPIIDIPMMILIVIRLVIGITLVRVAMANPQLKNIRWLAGFYLAMVISNSLSLSFLTNTVSGTALRTGVMAVALLPLAAFIYQTFYPGKRLTGWIFIGVPVLLALGCIFFSVKALDGEKSTLMAAYSFAGMIPLILWAWHVWPSVRSYSKVRNEPMVEDWVKWRYKAMMAYSGLQLFAVFTNFLGVNPAMLSIIVPLGSVISLVSITLQYLVWVAPEGFRNYLNRNYKAPEQVEFEELSEEELMAQMIKS